MLQLYVDSAERHEVERWMATGLFTGVTTNPLLWARAGVSEGQLADLYAWISATGAGEVFLQAWGDDVTDLEHRSRELLALGSDVVVKLPTNEPGLSVATRLASEGSPVLLTAVYDAKQAVLAAAAGVAYIAPYVGRMQDAGRDGIGEVAAMQRILAASGSRCQVLAASLRQPSDLVLLAEVGVRCFTLAPPLIGALLHEPSTEEAVADFERALLR